MKITDQQLVRFHDMVRDFSMRNGLTSEINTDLLHSSDVRFSKNGRWKGYVVTWSEVRSLTEAGARIFADAINFFGLNKDETCINPFDISNVIFSNPATIVLWADGTKTVVKCQEDDIYSEEVGLALCFAKKALGNKSNYNNVFKKWVPEVQSDYVYWGMAEAVPSDQMVAQSAIEKLNSIVGNVKSPAEIVAECKDAINRAFGNC